MSFIEKLKKLVEDKILIEPFTVQDVKSVTSDPEANNLSNYAKDNAGSTNLNNKVLNRRKIKGGLYEYWF